MVELVIEEFTRGLSCLLAKTTIGMSLVST